jgi:hypothetical protein
MIEPQYASPLGSAACTASPVLKRFGGWSGVPRSYQSFMFGLAWILLGSAVALTARLSGEPLAI